MSFCHTQDLEPTAQLSIPGLANDTMEFVRALGLEQVSSVVAPALVNG